MYNGTKGHDKSKSDSKGRSDTGMFRYNRTRVLYISLAAIFSAFIVEMTLGIMSNSLALITDSIHALLDCVVTAVLLIAVRMAIKPPDAEHTYGHGKIESLGGMMGGIAILIIACFFIYESLYRLQSPPPSITPGLLAIAGGLYTIGVDTFRIVLLKKSLSDPRGKNSTAVRADLYHAIMDLASTGVAIAGIALAYGGAYQGDFAAALILGGLLAALSIKLVHKTAMDLTDVISPKMVADVRRITDRTDGVVRTVQVLMRRSGDTVFADITILLRGDASFDRAHEISANVEKNVEDVIAGASVTVHFEPDWRDVPVDSKISSIAKDTDGVKGVHNINTHKTGGKTYADLHVMVDRSMSLASAHAVSESVESKISEEIPEITHTTVHLEPFTAIPQGSGAEDSAINEIIRGIIRRYAQVKKIGRIVSLNFEGTFKISIDCSFDGSMTIENVHTLISEIERAIADGIEGGAIITIHPEPI